SSVTFTFFSAAKSLDTAPPVFAMSPPADERETVKQRLLNHYPTMQGLFGSLDFCDCEECRSVLSPAAYLVDLLEFLDHKPTDWQSFLSDWKRTHNDAPYPFQDQAQFADFLTDWKAHHSDPAPGTE